MAKFLNVVRPGLSEGSRVPGATGRYRRIWWRTVILMLVVALLPLGVMTLVNYYLFTKGRRSDLQHQISQDLSHISDLLESVIEERVAALQFLAAENDLATMTQEDLDLAYGNLRVSFGGFVDLGVIDREGTQRIYTGPYNLAGQSYREETWVEEVRLRDVFVSDVLLGHRQLPHFVVVVRSGEDLLRATLDMALLNARIFIPAMGPRDDVFLVNRAGVLQTDSRLHGGILASSTLPLPPYSPNDRIQEGRDEAGFPQVIGSAYIDNTAFVLLVVRGSVDTFAEWLTSSVELAGFLLISLILIVVVVFWSSTATVRKIQVAERERAHVLRGIEYNSKMATIGRLAASVAHEVNNPLAVINEKAGLLVDLIDAEEDFPHKQKSLESLQWILRMVERCGSITHRLLGFTQRLRLRRQKVDLRALGHDVLGFLEKEALHRSIEVTLDVADNVPSIFSDQGQLEEVLLNLLHNAFAAVDDGGRIEVSVRTAPSAQVVITVKDNGCGIPEEDLPQVFEPFYSTKGEFGTGLGLSISYDLVRKLGGRIDVESEIGVGSSFHVYLPCNPNVRFE